MCKYTVCNAQKHTHAHWSVFSGTPALPHAAEADLLEGYFLGLRHLPLVVYPPMT